MARLPHGYAPPLHNHAHATCLTATHVLAQEHSDMLYPAARAHTLTCLLSASDASLLEPSLTRASCRLRVPASSSSAVDIPETPPGVMAGVSSGSSNCFRTERGPSGTRCTFDALGDDQSGLRWGAWSCARNSSAGWTLLARTSRSLRRCCITNASGLATPRTVFSTRCSKLWPATRHSTSAVVMVSAVQARVHVACGRAMLRLTQAGRFLARQRKPRHSLGWDRTECGIVLVGVLDRLALESLTALRL